MLTILILLVALWLGWKLIKFSFWLLGVIAICLIGAFFLKVLIIPAIAIFGRACFSGLRG